VVQWGFAIDPISTIFVIPLLGSTASGMTFGFETNENEISLSLFPYRYQNKWHFSLTALTLKMRLRLGKAARGRV
jgi:hypothetical protein